MTPPARRPKPKASTQKRASAKSAPRKASTPKPAARKPASPKAAPRSRPTPKPAPSKASPAKRTTPKAAPARTPPRKAAAAAKPSAVAPPPRKAGPARASGVAPQRTPATREVAKLTAAPPAVPRVQVVEPAADALPAAPPETAPAGGPLTCEQLLQRIVALLHERRAEDIVALDVRGLADYMDFLVVASGRSDRQNRAIADGVMRGLKGLKVRPLMRPGPEDGRWICLDFVDVVLHVFDGATRAHYDLENLWGDAPRVALPSAPAPVPAPAL